MFVDASALCAIMLDEPDRAEFEATLVAATDALTSPIAVWETVRAMTREIGVDPHDAARRLEAYLAAARVRVVSVGPLEGEAAVLAMTRFGKGRHAASLNMGDCFAYACAVTNRTSLLFKGDDFALTDIPSERQP